MRCCTAMPPPSAAIRSMDCVGDGLGVVEEPMQAVERHVLVHALEHVEGPADRLVVGGVQPPRPAVLGQDAHDRFESPSISGGMSGRGSRKSSKSAAENTSISPAPLWRK